MSKSSETASSNAEIVDELVQNVGAQLKVDTENDNLDSKTTGTENEETSWDDPQDEDGSDKDSKSENVSDDYIDEENLKDIEVNLTDEEKESRHKEALELKEQGNNEFKEQKYLECVDTYTKALRICPLQFSNDRSVLYANRAAAKAKLERKQSALDDCTKAVELNDKYTKAFLRRAKLYEEIDKLDESLADYQKILELEPGQKDALQAQYRLPPLINERNEKLKTEMLGKLKDLGNLILRPFGLSTDNFQLNQDPNSGGYSVNFTQNPGSGPS